MHSRRTFAATTRDVLVDARLSVGPDGVETFMGAKITGAGPRTLRVHTEGYTEVARVEIVRNGEVVHVTAPQVERPADWLALDLRLEWGESDLTTEWDGTVRIAGGEIIQSPFGARRWCT